MSTLIAFILLALLFAVGIYNRRQRKMIEDLRTARDKIEGEEQRAFEFLHGLGCEISRSQSSVNIHRFVVEGISQVLESDGAAIYLLNQPWEELVPKFVSDNCPIYLEVPDNLLNGQRGVAAERLNYLRLRSFSVGHPLFGPVLKQGRGFSIENLADHPRFPGDRSSQIHQIRLLAAPLIYAGRPIGLLIVGRRRDPRSPEYTGNDVSVFASLVDQSAFALGSAMIHREAQEKRLLETELRTASEFQRILLPASAPKLAQFDISGVNYPARIVSGDYFDYVPIDQEHLGIAIADVAGKGFPASLIMATCRSVLRAKAAEDLSPSRVLGTVNRQIFPDIREDMFITMVYVVLDGQSDTIRVARAGHNPALVLRYESGEVEALEPMGMAVGIDSGEVFERILSDVEYELHPKDAMILYTDGLTEALNSRKEEYGQPRLRAALAKFSGLDAEENRRQNLRRRAPFLW